MEFRKVIVGFDGSPASRQALAAALNLVDHSVPIIVIGVEEALPQYVAMRGEVDEAKREADDYFKTIGHEAAEAAKLQGREVKFEVLRGHAGQKVVEFARKEEADLIVIGFSGHSGVWGTFLGTTADKIVRHAPCSVLVVREIEQ
jgi:nucleotide-binding universal stress UspA family protein